MDGDRAPTSDPRRSRWHGLVQAGSPADVVDVLQRVVESGADADLVRIDPLTFAATHGLDPERTVDTFVHAAKLGLLEMSLNLACPGCGGILEAGATLKTIRKPHYACSMCVESYEPHLDEMVEVTFTVSPSVRRVAAHDPESLSAWEYYRQLYFGSGTLLPPAAEWERIAESMSLACEVVPPRERMTLALNAPAEWLILFDPVTHATTMLDVHGEPTRERQEASVVFGPRGSSPEAFQLRPGPLRLSLENRTGQRILPTLWVANDALHDFLKARKPFLTAARLFTNQTFRDLYQTDILEIDQRMKLTSLTVLFTDLKGSTGLYERVGDLAAYDLVRNHFQVLSDVVRSHAGAVVKTIGDAVMATFPTADRGVGAALEMRSAMEAFNAASGRDDLVVKIGLHEGPCLAVMSNERLDYFGQTVNLASRVQALAESREILTTERVATNPSVERLLAERRLTPTARRAMLKGIRTETTVYEIP